MIKYLRDKYYWYRVNTKIESYFKNKYENKILIYGFPKSGNTWVRFLIYNYLNLLNNINVTKTISFDKLNELQNNVMDRGTTFYNKKGYPIIYRTHKIFVKPYLLFDKRIFIHRNPLDTLISSYYFYKNREIPFSGDDKKYRDLLFDINFYVRYKLEDWINFYTQSVKYAHLNINYSDIISNPHRILLKIVEFLDLEVNKKFIDKSVEFSKINNIRVMSLNENQQYGNGPKDGSFHGEFIRDGKESQFYQELESKTIDFVISNFPDFNQIYPNLIEK